MDCKCVESHIIILRNRLAVGFLVSFQVMELRVRSHVPILLHVRYYVGCLSPHGAFSHRDVLLVMLTRTTRLSYTPWRLFWLKIRSLRRSAWILCMRHLADWRAAFDYIGLLMLVSKHACESKTEFFRATFLLHVSWISSEVAACFWVVRIDVVGAEDVVLGLALLWLRCTEDWFVGIFVEVVRWVLSCLPRWWRKGLSLQLAFHRPSSIVTWRSSMLLDVIVDCIRDEDLLLIEVGEGHLALSCKLVFVDWSTNTTKVTWCLWS